LLDKQRAGDIPVVAGGIIPVEDIPALKEMGVREIFLPATPTDEIVEFFKSLVQKV
jgi:methylmalonyl-CoA mutase C-terminal domain/subunit